MDNISDSENLGLFLANAPGRPLIWERFLSELIRQLDCDSSALLVTDLSESENTHFLYSCGIPQDYQETYENKLNKLDDFNHFISENPYRIFYNQTLSEFDLMHGNDFVPPENQNHRFGVSIPCNHKHTLSLIAGREYAFSEDHQLRVRRILEKTVPALEDAIHAEQRQKIDNHLRHYLGYHFDAYIIVDQKLNILFSDPILTSIIAQMDCVKISGQRFGMAHSGIERQILSLIERNQVASIPNHCQSCQIVLTPISSLKNLYQWECFKDGYVLTFTYNKEKDPVIERLSEIYRLSRCEAVCAQHFMKTPSIPEIAANTFRSQETVRNHIKHIMQKMEVHSQAELMKKLLALASLN
ncbi:MAG: helix-turn-helix transcriptional regulator [Gammaproteobacteria bacterium]